MREILVKNSKLKLVYFEGLTKAELKKELSNAYKKSYIKIDSNGKMVVKNSLVDNSTNKSDYIIMYEGNVVNDSSVDYTEFEKNTLLESTLALLQTNITKRCGNYLNIIESIVRSFNNSDISFEFYRGSVEKFSEYLKALLDYNIKVKKSINYIPQAPIYGSYHSYTILEFLEDLVKSNAEVLIDSTLINGGGKYINVTKTIKPDPNIVKVKPWAKVLNYHISTKRSNVSIKVKTNVTVNIPNNSVGVQAGEVDLETIKSYCIILDGFLWVDTMMIRTKDKNLIKKINYTGLGKYMLNNEYLIDLTKRPIIRHSSFASANETTLFKLDMKYYQSSLAKEFISVYKLYKDNNIVPESKPKIAKVDKSEKEAFLESIGIFGNYYTPNKTVEDVNNNEYTAINYGIDFKTALNYQSKWDICKKYLYYKQNPAHMLNRKIMLSMFSFLDTVKDDIDSRGFDVVKDMWVKQEKTNKKLLSAYKFAYILSKKPRKTLPNSLGNVAKVLEKEVKIKVKDTENL